MDMDWELMAKKAVVGGINLGNETAGTIAEVLIGVFWVDKTSLWDKIRAEVEALVDAKIDDYAFNTAKGHLDGWRDLFRTYGALIQKKAAADAILDKFRGLNNSFILTINEFQTKGHEVTLLPFFVQAANMHLSVLRDHALHGADWGMEQVERDLVYEDFKTRIVDYQAHVKKTMALAEAQMRAKVRANAHACEPFRSVNAYMRRLTLTAQDFADMWPWFDPIAHPPATDPAPWPTREIYSDPWGTCDNSGDIYAHLKKAPTAPMKGLVVHANQDRIFALRTTYPAGKGPDGRNDSGDMGAAGRGSELPPYGGRMPTEGPATLVAVDVRGGDVIEGLTVVSKAGARRSFGHQGPDVPAASIWLDGHLVSSLHINGVSTFYACADCLVVGFKYDPTTMTSTDMLQRMFTASPTPITLEQILAATVSPVSLADLTAIARDQDWDGKRKAYWRKSAALV